MKNDSNTNQTAGENRPQDMFFELSETLESGFEFLLLRENGAQISLKRGEIEPVFENGKAFLQCMTGDGLKVWRIISGKREEKRLLLAAAAGSDSERLELIPRITAADLLAGIKGARLEKAGEIAAIVAANVPNSKIARLKLSPGIRAGEYGGSAQILLQTSGKEQAAVFAQVVSKIANPEAFLVSAMSWFFNISGRAKNVRIEQLWLVADKRTLTKLKKIVALMKPRRREQIRLFTVDEENKTIGEIKVPEFNRLWREKPRKLKIPREQELSETARHLKALAPEAIDVTFSAHGENLRFHGLPFARVRTLLGKEKAWFGIDRKRRILDEDSGEDLFKFFEELKANRNHETTNKAHYFFRASPEHWLESILRRDITQLDANLILSPIYHQFRAAAKLGGQIDLLALRRDGRLVIIELKVSPSRELVFQAAGYWRQIEIQRRSGNLAKARAFGDLEIADVPALVYLVAPALSFHRDLEMWAATISSKIEMYRYDLHENWRENIKVLQRTRIG
ncbi:MAG TPA: hypothetical protein VGO50_06375 [Pyrinomonadaceae bacterium]|nr:hypothetical protein [Pyrinomonadaceae bacterium]